MEVSEPDRRLLVRSAVGTAGLVGLSGTAVAHGPHGTGGEPVAFAVVVGLPIVAGLLGGGVAVRYGGADWSTPTGHRTGVVLGVLLAVLGATLAASAVTTNRSLGIAGGAVGGLAALLATRNAGVRRRGCHATLALGAVSGHRLLEGIALAALYSTGATVGLVGAVLIAGHTVLETAAVGGTYATSQVRAQAVGAVVLVQVSYALGALAGLGAAGALPVSARAVALAVGGGVLLVVGAGETERSITSLPPASA